MNKKSTSPVRKKSIEKDKKSGNFHVVFKKTGTYDYDYNFISKEDNKFYGLKEIRIKKIVRKLI